MFKKYYYLAKPGIVYGNLITAAAGFFLASQGHLSVVPLLAMLVGIALVMAAGCVFNNYYDRDIDRQMARTKNRALVVGDISNRNALMYGTILGVIGFCALYFFANKLTAGVALVGFVFYVFVYTPLKRKTIHGTILGSIPGAVPPVVGYCAVTSHLDLGALLMFAVLVFWQMPHFYSIAIYRHEDYSAAGIPTLPVKLGIPTTKIYIIFYIVLYIIAVVKLFTTQYTGVVYAIIMAPALMYWLALGIVGFRAKSDDRLWAKKMFRVSLLVLLVFSLSIPIDAIIHI
ncbi:MAG: heme o synthase [Candidatus Doudnabacteria bacterium]|nr:heme o synthase [Candidatus Doudnabacteria bacterium]